VKIGVYYRSPAVYDFAFGQATRRKWVIQSIIGAILSKIGFNLTARQQHKGAANVS